MRKALLAALLLAVSLVLSACSISVSGGGADLDDDVYADARALETNGEADLEEEPAIVGSITLAPGERRLYRVQVPSSPQPALFVYTNAAVDLWLYRGNQRLYGTSSSPDFFAGGSGGLSLRTAGEEGAEPALEPQIAPVQVCPGSCVIMDNPDGGYVYVGVENDTSSVTTFSLYAVLRDFADENEGFGAEAPMPIGGSESGAIETLDDVDYYEVADTGVLYFDYGQAAESGIDLVAEVRPTGGAEPFMLEPNDGDGFPVVPGDTVRVYAENGRAAASAMSRYFLEVVPEE